MATKAAAELKAGDAVIQGGVTWTVMSAWPTARGRIVARLEVLAARPDGRQEGVLNAIPGDLVTVAEEEEEEPQAEPCAACGAKVGPAAYEDKDDDVPGLARMMDLCQCCDVGWRWEGRAYCTGCLPEGVR